MKKILITIKQPQKLGVSQAYPLDRCPFNPAHTFDPNKYFHHIGRCKEGKKNRHLYQTCSFNGLHIVKKQDIQQHEASCIDGQESRTKLNLDKEQVMKAIFKRQIGNHEQIDDRQIQEIQQQKGERQQKGQIQYQGQRQQRQQKQKTTILQCCQECLCTLKSIELKLIMISKNKRDRLNQLLKKYEALWKKQQEIKLAKYLRMLNQNIQNINKK